MATVGKLLHYIEQRDAVHVALIVGIALEACKPGDKVCFVPENKYYFISGEEENENQNRFNLASAVPEDDWDGIVDPFLDRTVESGQICWVMMKPGSTTPERHHFAVESRPDETHCRLCS